MMIPRSIGWSVALALCIANTASADPMADARAAYDDGSQAYLGGDFDRAIASWTRSFELSGNALVLLNLGNAYRKRDHDGDCATALATYRRFEALAPTSPNRADADDFIRELAAKCEPAPAAPVATHDDAAPRGQLERRVGIVVAGAGLVAIIGGIYFGHRASSLADEVTSACADPAHPCMWGDEKDKDSSGHSDATLGRVLDAVGVATLVGGAVLYYLGDRQSEVRVAPIATGTHAKGAVMSWGGSW